MNYKSEFQLLLTAYESILPFDMHVKFSLTLMGVTRAYYGITRPLGVNIYFRQTALLKFIKKKRERRRYQWEKKNPLWVLWKQKYHSVHFWSAGGSEKKVMYRYSIASMYLILPAHKDTCEDVHQHACTREGEPLLSHPEFRCQSQPQLVQISSAPPFPLNCPIYTSWAGDTGSVGVLEVLGLSSRLSVK